VATIAVRGPGESFGELALLVPAGKRSATVAALEEVRDVRDLQREFEPLRRQYAQVDHVLLRFLVNEVWMLHQRLLEALYVPVERRVLRRLVELAQLYPGAEGMPVIALTQEALSELAGASRATVNQVLPKRKNEERSTFSAASDPRSCRPQTTRALSGRPVRLGRRRQGRDDT
jgi:CRP-like cAMP-binding protein